MPSESKPPEYQPLKKCLRMFISSGLIFRILWYFDPKLEVNHPLLHNLRVFNHVIAYKWPEWLIIRTGSISTLYYFSWRNYNCLVFSNRGQNRNFLVLGGFPIVALIGCQNDSGIDFDPVQKFLYYQKKVLLHFNS